MSWDNLSVFYDGNGDDQRFLSPNASDMSALAKALTVGNGSSWNSTGGRSLMLEDLETTLKLTTFGERQFSNTLFNILKLKATQASSVVHEYIRLNDYGGGAGFSPEVTDNIAFSDAQLQRANVKICFARVKRAVSDVSTMTGMAASTEATQIASGNRVLLAMTEQAFYDGDSAMTPDEPDGLYKIATGSGNVVNMNGQVITRDALNYCAQGLADASGVPSHLFMPNPVQSMLDKQLVGTQDRLMLNDGRGMPFSAPSGYLNEQNAVMFGNPAAGFRSSFGNITFRPHIFFGRKKPFLLNAVEAPTSTSSQVPATPTGLGCTPLGTGGGFTGSGTGGAFDAPSGYYKGVYAAVYKYRVSAENSYGESIPCAAVSAIVASGGQVTVAWTAVTGATAYRVYRSQAGISDAWLVARVAAPTVSYVDINQRIAGTFEAYMLDLESPGELGTVGWAQLAPLSRKMLPVGDTDKRWLQFLYGAMCMYAPTKLRVFSNIGLY